MTGDLDRADDQLVLRAVGRLECPQGCVPDGVAVLTEDVQRPGKVIEQGMLYLAVVGEHDQPLTRAAEVVDPAARGVQLAARGEQLEGVQPHEALGAQCRGHLRVELAQVERLALKPRDHVALGEPVLGLVVEPTRTTARVFAGSWGRTSAFRRRAKQRARRCQCRRIWASGPRKRLAN